jgi:hypothetical protein
VQPRAASLGGVKWTTAVPDRAWHAAGADVDAQIDALFRRCPELCGFSVQPKVSADGNTAGEEELFVTAIGIEPGAPRGQYAEIFEQIALTLKDLLAERPEAHALLRGRTFARFLH